MNNRHHQATVLSIFSRLGWRCRTATRPIRCRDGAGLRSTLAVRTGNGYVALESPTLDIVYLSPMQVGQLRGALRNALIDLDVLGGEYAEDNAEVPGARHTTLPSRLRRMVSLRQRTRPSVAEIVARVTGHDSPEQVTRVQSCR